LKFSVSLRNEKIEAENADLEYMGLEHIESWTGKRIEDETAFSEGIATRFEKDDVLFGKLRPYLAKVYLAEKDGMATTEALVMMCEPALAPAFLKHLLLSDKFIDAVSGSTYGAKMPRANWEDIGSLPILLPSCDEQEQIAAFLDWKTGQIDALIAKKKELLKKLKEKRLAVITQAVTKGLSSTGSGQAAAPLRDSGIPWLGQVPKHWEVKRLKFQAAEGKGGGIKIGPFGGMLTELIYADNGDFKLYGQENVLSDDFNKGTRWITSGQFTDLIQYQVEAGDFLFTRKGSIGGCAIFPKMAHLGIIDSDTIRLRVNDKSVDIRFLRHAFQDSLYLQAQVQLTKRGAILSGLNTTTIADLLVTAPPIEEQVEIADFLDQYTTRQIDLECKVEVAIARLTEYRTALITAATTGKIDVRDVAIPVLRH